MLFFVCNNIVNNGDNFCLSRKGVYLKQPWVAVALWGSGESAERSRAEENMRVRGEAPLTLVFSL